jgi:hypothetical protein
MLNAAEKKKQDQTSLFLDETDGWLADASPASLGRNEPNIAD